MSQNPYDDFKRQWIARRNRPNTASDIDHILNDNINCSPPNVSFRHLRWIRGTQTIELLNAAGEHITQLTHSQARRLNSLGWLRSDLPVIVRNETFADSAASSNPTTATYTLNQVLNHIEDNTPPPPSSTLISDLVGHCIDALTGPGGGGGSGGYSSYTSSPRLPPIPAHCSLCGRYCSWPTYYKGLPYGSYCIQKVRGW